MKEEYILQQSVNKRRSLVHHSYIVTVDDPAEREQRKQLFSLLVSKAKEKYDEISPVAERKSLEECITRQGNRVYLWFNTSDGSTHIVTAPIVSESS